MNMSTWEGKMSFLIAITVVLLMLAVLLIFILNKVSPEASQQIKSIGDFLGGAR